MKTLCVAVVLSLISVCWPAPLACDKLLKPVYGSRDVSVVPLLLLERYIVFLDAITVNNAGPASQCVLHFFFDISSHTLVGLYRSVITG